MKYIAFSLLLTIVQCATAQVDAPPEVSDSLASYHQFLKDSAYIMRVKLVRPQFRFDNRNVYFKGQMLAVGGYDFGVLLKDKLRVTLGFYHTNNNLSRYDKVVDELQYDRRITLNYGTISTEFTYINSRFFSLGMPLEFGFGENTLRYKETEDATAYQYNRGFVIVTDFGLSGTFKPIRWVGIRAVVGYRKNVVNQVQDLRFDGIFTSVGLNIDFREVTKDFQMYRLKKRYGRMDSKVGTAVDLIVD